MKVLCNNDKNPILILLAGGRSDRMGFPKGLLNFNGQHWLLEQISRYKDILDPKVYIGLGFDYQLYLKHIPWLEEALKSSFMFEGVEVKTVLNKQPKLGAFSTLQAVLYEINVNRSVLVQPIDVPLLNMIELKKLCALENEIVLPSYNTKNGHPVKLSTNFWKPLLEVDCHDEEARLDLQIKKRSEQDISYFEVSDNVIIENLNNETAWVNYKTKKSSVDQRSF